MAMVIRVRFKRAAKLYDFDPNGLELHNGMSVVTETARGVELGECMSGVMDVPGVVNLYKEDKERQKLVLDTLEIALRDILVQQAGGASVADAGYAREALDYASRVPLSGGLTLMETLRRARVMLASNVAFASAFETVLLQISEEYAKWPW